MRSKADKMKLLSIMGMSMTLSYAQQMENEERKKMGWDKRSKFPEISTEETNENKNVIIPNGHKEFNFGGVIIYALNQKNADKKARKLGLL